MMRSKWSGHAFADDIDYLGELVGHFGLGPVAMQLSECVQKCGMNADILTAQRRVHRIGPTGPCIGTADDHTVAAQVSKVPAVPLVAGVTKDPLETLLSENKGRLGA